MRIFGSIRAKIWLCVLVALTGYCIATLCNLYTNITHYRRLSQLETIHVPLAALSSDILHTFQKQTERYEDAFLAGERDMAIQGNQMSDTLLGMLDTLRNQTAQAALPAVTLTRLDSLIDEYRGYSVTAAQVYTEVASAEFPPESQEAIQRLGQRQVALLRAFTALDKDLASQLTLEIENNKTSVFRNALFVGMLFLFVLVAAACIIDRVARRLLVQPLARIQEDVNRFSLSQDVPPPAQGSATHDEIGRLAKAFWEMTEKLKHTMVSQRYVDNIIRNISSGLVVSTPTGTIQTVNPRILELFGLHENELIGQPLEILFARDDRHRGSAPYRSTESLCSEVPIYDREVLCQAKEGVTFPTHFSSAPMYNEQGALQGFVCIFNDITELKKAESKLKQLAHYDPLTGVANRTLFFARLDEALENARREEKIFALLYIDLDKFKPINDTLGHDIGDLILKKVAKRLLHLVRTDDTVARVGGDEFTIILNGLHNADDAVRVAQKIVRDLAAPFVINDITQTLGASVGITLFPADGLCAEDLLVKADQAMYEAKAQGRNGYSLYKDAGTVLPSCSDSADGNSRYPQSSSCLEPLCP